uniref:Chondroitin proteoglycan 4 domain-containing protein n=1 Tax=Acrobeloides nanus TaxID=290746 RepID=A0A914DHI7_9BILA
MPGRYLYKHEVSSWQCAQSCFDRADMEDSFTEELSSSYRRKRDENSLGKFEMLEFQISRHLYDHCSKSQEELTCLEACPESDVKSQLLELGTKVEHLACSNVAAAVKTYKCVLRNEDIPDCVAQNCKQELKDMSSAIKLRIKNGERVIPGKEFCSLENCNHRCKKQLLPDACGEHSFSLYKSLSDFSNIVQALLTFDVDPQNKNGLLCIDRPLPEISEDESK